MGHSNVCFNIAKKKKKVLNTQIILEGNRLTAAKAHFICLLLFIFDKRITWEKDKLECMEILNLWLLC